MAVNWKVKLYCGSPYLEVNGRPSSWSRQWNMLYDEMDRMRDRAAIETKLMAFDISLTRFLMMVNQSDSIRRNDYLWLDAASCVLAVSAYENYLFAPLRLADLEVA